MKKLPGGLLPTPTNRAGRPAPGATKPAEAGGKRRLADDEAAPGAMFEAHAPGVGRAASAAARAIGQIDLSLAKGKAGAGARAAKAAVTAHAAPSLWSALKKGARAATLGVMLLAGGVGTAFGQTTTTPGPGTSTRTELLLGKAIPQDATKVAKTGAYEVHLASRLADGTVVPDLRFVARTIADPAPRPSLAPVSARDAAGFAAHTASTLQSLDGYLNPDKAALLATLPADAQTAFSYNNIRGQRVSHVFDLLGAQLESSSLASADKTKARQALNAAYADQFRGRDVVFDDSDTKSYWSYGHDAPFVKVFEQLLGSMTAYDPRRPFLQNQLDFVFTHKYVTSGAVDENDAEKTMGLVAIDKTNRHVVSMTPETAARNRGVQYETLKITTGEHAGKYAYRSGDAVMVEGTQTKLSAADSASLYREAVSNVVFRRAVDGESLRDGFRYDWNGNRMIELKKVDTGWWGHCDIRAVMEALLADMKGSGGVTEFRSDAGSVTEYTRDHQLEALAAMLNFGDAYIGQGGGRFSFGQHLFAGSRFDDVPTRLDLRLDNGSSLRLDVKLTGLSERGDAAKSADLDRTFSPFVPDADKQTFAANPTVLSVVDGDVSVIDGSGRKIEGTLDGWTFDEKGRPVAADASFTIDLASGAGARVLVASEISDVDARTLDRYYFEPSTKEVVRVPTKFVERDGTFAAQEGAGVKVGAITGAQIGREMKFGDDAADKLEVLERAARTGQKMANDADTDMQVWNGAQTKVRLSTDYRSPDGKWERISVHVDARFGAGKVGEFMRELDENGKPVRTIETKAAVDFFWWSANRVAPLIADRGQVYLNEEMLERGVISLSSEQGKVASLGALQDVADIIYLGLQAKDQQKLYTIVHDGKRLVYQDAATWRADVEKLRSAAINATKAVGADIGDVDSAGVKDTIKVAESGPLSRIHVDLDVTHANARHLTVELTAPDGTTVTLHAKDKGTAGGLSGTFGLDLDGAALAKLVGKDVRGDWTLKVVDDVAGDAGKLVSWGLHLDTGTAR